MKKKAAVHKNEPPLFYVVRAGAAVLYDSRKYIV